MRGCGAQVKFDSSASTVEEVEIPLGGNRDQAVSVAAKGDITLLPVPTALTSEEVIATEKSEAKMPYQMSPVEKYSGEEEEVKLCEIMVKGTENFPILIANTVINKTIRVPRDEKLGYPLLLGNISHRIITGENEQV